MNIKSCPFERQVLMSAKANEWTQELRAHIQSCALCGETVRVAVFMQRLALKTSNEIVLPVSGRVLWIKVQFTRRETHLSKLDYIMLAGSLAVVFGAIVGVVIWKWQFLQTLLTGISIHSGSNLPIYTIVGCAALVWFLTEELFVSDG